MQFNVSFPSLFYFIILSFFLSSSFSFLFSFFPLFRLFLSSLLSFIHFHSYSDPTSPHLFLFFCLLIFPPLLPFLPFSSPLLSSLHTPGRKAFVFYLHNKGGCCARSSEEPGKRNILILTLHLLYLLPRLCLYHLHHFVSSLSSLYSFTLFFSPLPFNKYSFINRLIYLPSSHLSLHVLFLP